MSHINRITFGLDNGQSFTVMIQTSPRNESPVLVLKDTTGQRFEIGGGAEIRRLHQAIGFVCNSYAESK